MIRFHFMELQKPAPEILTESQWNLKGVLAGKKRGQIESAIAPPAVLQECACIQCNMLSTTQQAVTLSHLRPHSPEPLVLLVLLQPL